MDIRLKKMSIKNFKGIKDFTLNADGNSIMVKGDNATYKTSCYDAFCWVVSGKNSFNQTGFDIKPLDENGKEIHFLETEVAVELMKDGKLLKLKKVQTENWVKPHGKTEQEYRGNNTTYFFDEVPVGANEYKSRIEELIGEEVFRLLTNPMYFNLYYKVKKLSDWQSRRMLLFEMCGETTDEAIIAANSKLSQLPDILDEKSIDDRKAIIKQSIKKINVQIDKIGPAINENMRLIPEIEVDYSETEKELAELKKKLDIVEQELSNAGNIAKSYLKKQQNLSALEKKLAEIKVAIDKEVNFERIELIEEQGKLSNEKISLETAIKINKSSINEKTNSINNNLKKREKLISDYKSLNKEKYEIQSSEFTEPDEDSLNCPTCGHVLSQDIRESKIAKMKVKFTTDKESKIENIESEIRSNVIAGTGLKEKTETLKTEIDNLKKDIQFAEKKLKKEEMRLTDINIVLSEPTEIPGYDTYPEYKNISDMIKKQQSELDKPVEDTTADARQCKQDIQEEIDSCNTILNNRDIVKNAKDRIEELKKSERDLANQKSNLEGQQNLITEFIKTKANTLTEIMNSKFRHVQFRLFDIQVDGGIVEACDTMVNTNGKWVPFISGNTAGRVNAGIDIINALSEHYGVNVPIFIDNRESITKLADTNSQIISLIKPEIRTEADRGKYSKLVIEIDN